MPKQSAGILMYRRAEGELLVLLVHPGGPFWAKKDLGICPAGLKSNVFEIEWPPKSGRKQSFPEVDRAAWFPVEQARERILPSQRELIDRLERMLG